MEGVALGGIVKPGKTVKFLFLLTNVKSINLFPKTSDNL